MKKHYIIETICILLIFLFVYTAGIKLVNLQQTYHDMNNQPFPNWMTPYLVWGISFLELCIASLLLFNRTKKVGLWSSLILMSLFTGYIGAILMNFFSRVPCSCGGVIKELGWTSHLYFNLFFVCISLTAIKLLKKQEKENQNAEAQQVVFT